VNSFGISGTKKAGFIGISGTHPLGYQGPNVLYLIVLFQFLKP